MDGFTLTEFAFPVAPDDLDGFTVDEFAWVGGPEPPTAGALVCGVYAITPRVNGKADLMEC